MLRDSKTNQTFSLHIPGETLIGRYPSCDIIPHCTSVSKQHARIQTTITTTNTLHILLTDLNSRKGTYIRTSNQWSPITSTTRLHYNDCIKFGSSSRYYTLIRPSDSTYEDEDVDEDEGYLKETYTLTNSLHDKIISDNETDDTEDYKKDEFIHFHIPKYQTSNFQWGDALPYESITSMSYTRHVPLSLDGISLLLSIQGSLLGYIYEDPMYIVCICMYAAIRLCILLDFLQSSDEYLISAAVITVICGGLLLLHLLCAYQIYVSITTLCGDAVRSLHTTCVSCRYFLSQTDALHVARLLIAALYASFNGTGSVYKTNSFFAPAVARYALLGEEEFGALMALDSPATDNTLLTILSAWVGDVIQQCRKTRKFGVASATSLLSSTQNYFQLLQKIHTPDTQLPHILTHGCYLLTCICLPVFTYAVGKAGPKHLGWVSFSFEVYGAAVVLFICLFFLGMFQAARCLQMPYRRDGIPVASICDRATLCALQTIKATESQSGMSKVLELGLDACRPSLGAGSWKCTEVLTPSSKDHKSTGSKSNKKQRGELQLQSSQSED